MRVFSYGGGVQSTAALVLAAQGVIDYPTFLFCNVGRDSEDPKTLDYFHQYALPYARKHGITLLELHKRDRAGQIVTLYGHLTKPDSRSIGIPVRMNNSGAPGKRSCTYDYKIAVVDRWCRKSSWIEHIKWMKSVFMKRYGFTEPITKEDFPTFIADLPHFFDLYQPIEVGLGISLDEFTRVKPNMDPETIYWKVNTHPLIFEVPKPLTRQDCMNIIQEAGLPIPPKSACWFCPFHALSKWQQMRKSEPDLFWKAVALEAFLNERRRGLGMDEVWLTRLLRPLDEATTALDQAELLYLAEEEECEGYCFV